MKNIFIITLLLSLTACSKKDKAPENDILATQPNVLQASAPNPAASGVIVEYQTETETEEVVEVIVTEEEIEEEVEQPNNKNFLCDFSNQNELISVEIQVIGKTAILIGQGSDRKFTFDGFTLSPSGNENAAVAHENPDQLVENGKVIKISARIVMNEQINQGELQVSYKIKNDDKGITVTDFTKIADINNCSPK